MAFEPPFINVTCHRDEVEYVPNDNGTYTKMTLAKRPGTVAIVAAIMRRYPQLEIVPHVICGGASQSRVESELLDLHFLGIQNVVALTSISWVSRMWWRCVVTLFQDNGSLSLSPTVSVIAPNW